MNKGESVAYVRSKKLLILHKLIENFFFRNRFFMIEVCKCCVFDFKSVMNFLFERIGVIVKLVNLETDFRIFIGIERSNTAFC